MDKDPALPSEQSLNSWPVRPPPPPEPAPPLVFDPNVDAPEQLNRCTKLSLAHFERVLTQPYPDVSDESYPRVMKHKDNAANNTLNTAVKVDENRLMAERSPDVLERVIARVKQLVQEKKAVENAAPAQPTTIDAAPVTIIAESHEAPAEKQPPTIVEESPSVKDWSAFERISGQQPQEAASPRPPSRRQTCGAAPRRPTSRSLSPLQALWQHRNRPRNSIALLSQ